MESVFHLVARAFKKKNLTGGDVKYGPKTREQEQECKTDCSIYDKIQLQIDFLLNGGKNYNCKMNSAKCNLHAADNHNLA